jgi:cellobiose-specific phosphotransferase system component IIB
MNDILNEIAFLSGASGSFIYSRDKGVFHACLPEFFTEIMAEEAAGNIARMIRLAAMKGLDTQTFSISYDRFDILTVPVNETSLLLIICETGSNTSFVVATVSTLISNIDKLLTESPVQLTELQVTEDSDIFESSPGEMDSKTADALDDIRKALSETMIGPVADMVYEECFEKWTEDDSADFQRIPKLLNYISNEIDNPQIYKGFQRKIAHLF